MDMPEDTRRAPLRAHILASINPFQDASSGIGTTSRRKRKRTASPPPTAREKKTSERGGEDRENREDRGSREDREEKSRNESDKLRPRGGRIHFKKPGKDRPRRTASEERRRAYRRQEEGEDDDDDEEEEDRRRRRREEEDATVDGEEEDDDNLDRRRRHRHEHRHHHHHHHRRRRRSRSRSRTRADAAEPELEPEDPYAEPPLSPDAAFRQSLFDAMADDEGAAYWEAVYGQPVHEWGRQPAGDNNKPKTGLEAMTDDEYADYVRQRMWERSHEGRREAAAAAAQRQREADKKAEEARVRQRQEQAARDRQWADVEASLRRGAARKLRQQQTRETWQARWAGYEAAVRRWEAGPAADTMPWPAARPGTKAEAAAEAANDDDRAGFAQAVRSFFAHVTTADALRSERVRWHPDKVQQRLGGAVDAAVLRDVTAVFQVVDGLWRAAAGR